MNSFILYAQDTGGIDSAHMAKRWEPPNAGSRLFYPQVRPMLRAVARRELRQLIEAFAHEAYAAVPVVRNRAVRAILDALFVVGEISFTRGPKRIERAITQHAVEAFKRDSLMAREVIAFCMREEHVLVNTVGRLGRIAAFVA